MSEWNYFGAVNAFMDAHIRPYVIICDDMEQGKMTMMKPKPKPKPEWKPKTRDERRLVKELEAVKMACADIISEASCTRMDLHEANSKLNSANTAIAHLQMDNTRLQEHLHHANGVIAGMNAVLDRYAPKGVA